MMLAVRYRLDLHVWLRMEISLKRAGWRGDSESTFRGCIQGVQTGRVT